MYELCNEVRILESMVYRPSIWVDPPDVHILLQGLIEYQQLA